MTGEISCGWHTICGLVKNSRAIPTLELHGCDWKLTKIEHGVLTKCSAAGKHQAPPAPICTPSPPRFLSISGGPQGSHWLSSLYEIHLDFLQLTVPQVNSMQVAIAALLPRPQRIQSDFVYHMHKIVCICLLTLYLTVLQLCWKSSFYIGWILLNPQRWVWKIIVLLYESSSVLTF